MNFTFQLIKLSFFPCTKLFRPDGTWIKPPPSYPEIGNSLCKYNNLETNMPDKNLFNERYVLRE